MEGMAGTTDNSNLHETQSVDLQGAQSVTANIEMPAGSLELGGGSNQLLDANFSYADSQTEAASGLHGHQRTRPAQRNAERMMHSTFGRNSNDWNLHFGDSTPLDLSLNMGAGQSDMKLGSLQCDEPQREHRRGANEPGPHRRTKDMICRLKFTAASVRRRYVFRKHVGVRVRASGGIGSIDSDGLKRDGEAYINDAYGKTAATITMNVEGGIGEIRLEQEP